MDIPSCFCVGAAAMFFLTVLQRFKEGNWTFGALVGALVGAALCLAGLQLGCGTALIGCGTALIGCGTALIGCGTAIIGCSLVLVCEPERSVEQLLRDIDIMATQDGGYGHPVPATKETQDLCDQVKPKVEEETGKKYKEYKAVKYRREDVSRFVAGTNYLIKVHVGGDEYIHLIVFQALNGGEVSLTKAKDHQTKDSPLKTFFEVFPEPVSPVKS